MSSKSQYQLFTGSFHPGMTNFVWPVTSIP